MIHRLINVALFIGIMASYAVVMDSDHRAEMRESADLLDAQRQAQREAKRDMAAAKVCRETHGNSSFTWTADGGLVCVPRKPRNITKASL